MEILSKDHPTKEEYVVGRILSAFGMRKVATDKIKKLFENQEIK